MENRKVKFAKRETEILEAMKKGLRNREIATELGINQKTISTYVRRIKNKLDLSPDVNTYVMVKEALPHLNKDA